MISSTTGRKSGVLFGAPCLGFDQDPDKHCSTVHENIIATKDENYEMFQMWICNKKTR